MTVDYVELLQDLLPPGPAINREEYRNDRGKLVGSKMTLLLDAFAKSLERFDEKARLLVKEANPLYATQTLPARYEEAGLPLSCMQRAPDMETMRSEVLWAWSALGGASLAYFRFLLRKLNLPVRIREFEQFRVGQSTVGTPIYGDNWAYLWQVRAYDKSYKHFAAGNSTAGDPLQKWGFSAVVCLLNALKPAHTEIYFRFIPLPVEVWDNGNIDDDPTDTGVPFALLSDNFMVPLLTDETRDDLIEDATS